MAASVASPEIGRRYLRLSRILSIVGFVNLYLSYALVFAGEASGWMRALPFLYLAFLGPWLTSYVLSFVSPKRAGQITIDADVVRIERGRSVGVVPRADIASASAIERAGRIYVEITHRKGDLYTVLVPSIEQANATVDALGFGAGGRRQTIELARPVRRILHIGIAMLSYQATSILMIPFTLLAFITSVGAWLVPAMMGLLAILFPFVYRALKKRLRSPIVEIGDDGLFVTRGAKATFYPRSHVHGAQAVPGRGHVTLATSQGPTLLHAVWTDEARARAIVHALTARWAALPNPGAPPEPRAVAFGRFGRGIDGWRADLQARLAGRGYRSDGVSLEDAETVLRSAASPPDARIGAALALAGAGERVRVAAAAAPLADTKLRVAIEAVAAGREDPVLLEEVTTEPPRMRTERAR